MRFEALRAATVFCNVMPVHGYLFKESTASIFRVDGGSMFLRSVAKYLTHYTAFYCRHRRWNSPSKNLRYHKITKIKKYKGLGNSACI
jgi:hypothetical protein